jgi:hypothetical protein
LVALALRLLRVLSVAPLLVVAPLPRSFLVVGVLVPLGRLVVLLDVISVASLALVVALSVVAGVQVPRVLLAGAVQRCVLGVLLQVDVLVQASSSQPLGLVHQVASLEGLGEFQGR